MKKPAPKNKLNRTIFKEFKSGDIKAEEYYKQCLLNFFKKNPPHADTFFPLETKECKSIFDEPKAILGINIKVTPLGYTLQCIYKDTEQYSVSDEDFYKAVDKMFDKPLIDR